jgi:hypothetical protein
MYGVVHSYVYVWCAEWSKGRAARDAKEGSSKAKQQKQGFKESTMKEKGKLCSRKKGRKRQER